VRQVGQLPRILKADLLIVPITNN